VFCLIQHLYNQHVAKGVTISHRTNAVVIFNINENIVKILNHEKDHSIIVTLLKLYPSATLLNYDEINTIQFASTCKHIILSNGSFSAIIGYFSFFSTIYYPEIQREWHGDIFSISDWIKVKLN
jgi:hypothetical protein